MKTSFPSEFADLLSAEGRAFLRQRSSRQPFRRGATYVGFDDFITQRTANACYRLLDDAFLRIVKPSRIRLPARYVEWGKRVATWTQRNKTLFSPEATRAQRAVFHETKLLQMMASDSFVEFTHKATGLSVSLMKARPCQTTVYDEGDYVGLHCDYTLPHSFLDVHLTFINRHVAHQYLLYEIEPRFLSGVIDLAKMGSIGIYRLPVWHQVTPLVGDGRGDARRWIIMGSVNIDGADRQIERTHRPARRKSRVR